MDRGQSLRALDGALGRAANACRRDEGLEQFARQRAPREAHRRRLLDHDGRDAYTVVLISPTGAIRLQLVDPLLNSTQLETVRHFIGKR